MERHYILELLKSTAFCVISLATTSLLLGYASFPGSIAYLYVRLILKQILPEKPKARFRYGQWVKGEGCIYDRFTEEMILKPEDLLEIEYYTGGQDFGLNIAGVKIGYHEDKIYVVKDHGDHNTKLTNNKSIEDILNHKKT